MAWQLLHDLSPPLPSVTLPPTPHLRLFFSTHAGLFAVPQTCQVHSHLRASAFAAPCVWNTHPPCIHMIRLFILSLLNCFSVKPSLSTLIRITAPMPALLILSYHLIFFYCTYNHLTYSVFYSITVLLNENLSSTMLRFLFVVFAAVSPVPKTTRQRVDVQ